MKTFAEYAVTIPAVVGCSRCPDGRVLLRVHVLPNGAPTLLYLSAEQARQLGSDLREASDPK
jgi:hypothetical protein